VTDFGDFVRQIRRQKGLSMGDVSRRSGRFGKRISATHIGRIENNVTKTVSVDRLKALAKGLGVPVMDLLARASGVVSSTDSEELSLLTRFRELPPNRRADVMDIVDMLYSRKSSAHNLHIVPNGQK
jgi:transcriptional regulator with XRE-family HTH domain